MLTLKNHPFAVEAFFESSLVLTYAVPKEEIEKLLPPCLEPDVFNDRWAFIAIALVQTKDLRPKGFSVFMGNDFFLIGCRIFVRYTTNSGKKLRGLYILKSATDKRRMALLGNIFTHYNYTRTDIHFRTDQAKVTISSIKSDIAIEVNINRSDVSLPEGSPFKDWKEARRFAGPLPFTFTYNEKKGTVLIIEGVRENWTPRPVEVVKHHIGFINQKALNGIVLANAFIIENIPYHWKKGKTEVWKR
ncbi:uncharacterized protein DUF2071 [Chitinophaga niastensis]|uniref:Uncharacterized protein DUF2071 n=1 Tax=Chitinophaga niastensis TaxID=536980 RepID=A0A2P8HCG7_CHINA|nr:DUF2071 domain-containing protein [Chitinophaga niastensis]PSL43908.1 uncharacterized protein DUF2071 [Chitinophaga niastensis]